MSRLPGRMLAMLPAGLLTFAAGCIAPLDQEVLSEPRVEVPETFGGIPASEENGQGSAADLEWSELFGDPELVALVETALANNRELNIRVQEILIAQNEVRARTGEYLPRADAFVGAGLEKPARFTSQGAADELTGVPDPLQDYRFGFVASWEVDIWRRLRNSAKAATYRYLASLEGRNFLVTQLVAEIASSYYELLALDRRVRVLGQNIELQQDALELVRLEKQAARATELAVQRFEAEVLKNRSRQYQLEQEIIETENRINFLVGRFPQPVARNPERWDAPLPDAVRAGLPSELLENRPDVKRAELELAAARVDVQAAKARFYPSLSLEGAIGYQSFKAKRLVDTPESVFFDVGGNLVAPLLNRRAIRAEYSTATSEQTKAVLDYEQTVLQAFAEVTNRLALLGNLQQSYELESRQVEVLSRAIDVSTTLFRSARADYVEVLLTRRDALEAQMELVETRLRQKQALVHVYQALGGGWR